MDRRSIAYAEAPTLEAFKAALAVGAVAVFTEAEEAEALDFLTEHAETFNVWRIKADGTTSDGGRIVGNLSGPFSL